VSHQDAMKEFWNRKGAEAQSGNIEKYPGVFL
jgi:hypothetical protein